MKGTTCDQYDFFFNDTATTEIYTLSLHDALPIYHPRLPRQARRHRRRPGGHPEHPARPGVRRERRFRRSGLPRDDGGDRSEEHTSELQSRQYLLCRLLLEKKKRSCSSTPCCS